ncbi:HTH-type transcriptional regulator XynR [Deinococcus carri]|uniref:HTH-type transcriptional regulator XynR n=1 Tax=Deinococcus carri TaxID=1211323 RepID=A0ABP9WCX4_9DEIO
MLGTFEKARAVLDLYTMERPEWGVTEVARTLGMPTSSAHVLLASLAHMGLLHRTLAGRYRLGFKLLALTQVLLANTPWREVAQEEMGRLAQAFGETLHLTAFDGGQIVPVAGLQGRLPGSVRLLGVGTVLPAHTSASGKLLLAHRPREVVEAVLAAAGDVSGTVQVWDTLAEELEQIRSDGYAREASEHHPAVCSLAAPVRNHNGEVIAAMEFSLPLDRYSDRQEQVRDALMQACAAISSRIGYQPELSGKRPMVWVSVGGREELRPAPRRSRRKGHSRSSSS